MVRKSFVSGAIILVIAGLIVKVFGFAYRIYLSNLIGAEGMGLFQLIMPVYSLIILTLTSGISIAVSKMTAEEMAKNHIINLRRITVCAAVIVSFAGLIVSAFFFFNADFISKVILKDSRTYLSILCLIPCIPAIAAASALKGYFYGIQEVVPTAASQIVEQVVRIGLVVAMAGYFIRIGIEYACALAIVGVAIGEIANLTVLFVVYKMRKKKDIKGVTQKGIIRKRTITIGLLRVSVPISFNRLITSVLSTVELILIPRRLLASGMDYHASISEYGKLTGMAMPLITFPSVVTSALATTLVPAISEAISLKNFKTVNYRISKSIQFTFILGFIFTAIFLSYPKEIGNILYRRQNVGNILYLLSFSCVFLYLQQTLQGILNGLGKQVLLLRNTIMGSGIRIGFVYFVIPILGISGYMLGMVISSFILCCLNLYGVVKATGMVVDLRNWLFKPGLVGAVMFFSGKYIYSFFTIFNAGFTLTITSTIIGNVFIALFLMVLAGVLKKEEVFKLVGVKSKKR